MLRSGHAAENVDDGLLEFLGSVDSEDQGWHDYLARTDIDQVARRAGNAQGNPGARAPPASPPSAPPPVTSPAAGTPVTSAPPVPSAPPGARP
jgi:hypothetical protein